MGIKETEQFGKRQNSVWLDQNTHWRKNVPAGPIVLVKMVRLNQNASCVATIGCLEYSKMK